MTMQHQIHPDDERLAALAGEDPDVAGDAELRSHVSSCLQCSGVVDELAMLRSALAELPDLVPSRRLQLIPPVPELGAARGGWMRRLAAPVMAGGFALVMVGAIGTSGVLNFYGNAGQQIFQNVGSELDGESPLGAAGEEVSPRSLRSGGDTGAPGSFSSEDGHETRASDDESISAQPLNANPNREVFSSSDPRLPWLVLIGLGVGVLLAGLYLRSAPEPRAG